MLSGQSRPPTTAVIGCGPSVAQVSVHAVRPLTSVACVGSPARYHLPITLSVTAAPPTGKRWTTPSSSTDWLMTSTASSTGDPVNGGLGAMLDVTT
jgi:hypothetical protein